MSVHTKRPAGLHKFIGQVRDAHPEMSEDEVQETARSWQDMEAICIRTDIIESSLGLVKGSSEGLMGQAIAELKAEGLLNDPDSWLDQ